LRSEGDPFWRSKDVGFSLGKLNGSLTLVGKNLSTGARCGEAILDLSYSVEQLIRTASCKRRKEDVLSVVELVQSEVTRSSLPDPASGISRRR
jgi:hypothetical protein